MLEFLFILLGIVVGYNIRHEWNSHQENLVYEKVDAKVRHELEVSLNLNKSLLEDIALLKKMLAESNSNDVV